MKTESILVPETAVPTAIDGGRYILSTVNDMLYEVGYSDTKALRDVFRKHNGMFPIDSRKKYN